MMKVEFVLFAFDFQQAIGLKALQIPIQQRRRVSWSLKNSQLEVVKALPGFRNNAEVISKRAGIPYANSLPERETHDSLGTVCLPSGEQAKREAFYVRELSVRIPASAKLKYSVSPKMT